MVVALVVFMPVRGQVVYPEYCSPNPIEIVGPAAYVPGFQFIVTFSQPSGTSILTELTRKFNYTAEGGLKPLGDFYTSVGFQTDSVNEYVFRIKANYTQPVNQTITYLIVSAGESAGTHSMWCIARQIELIFHITTTKNPTSAEAIAEALDQRQSARDQQAQKRHDEDTARFDSLDNAFTNLIYAFTVVAAVAFYPIAQEIYRRWPRYG